MAQPRLLLRLLAASLAFNFAFAQTPIVQIAGKGVNIVRPEVRFPVSGRQPAGSRFETVGSATYTAPVGFDPPVNATVARAALDAIEVRDPAVDESTRTVEVRQNNDRIGVPFACPEGQYGVLMWAPFYHVYWGEVLPSRESFDVWFVQSNMPGEPSMAGEYIVDCFD